MDTLHTSDVASVVSRSDRTKEEGGAVIKLLTCIVREEKVDDVLKAICEHHAVGGVTMTPVQAYDPRSQIMTQFRGIVYPQTLSGRIRLEVAVPSEEIDEMVRAIRDAARTGKTGDGKIIVTDVSRIERIRTGEQNLSAV